MRYPFRFILLILILGLFLSCTNFFPFLSTDLPNTEEEEQEQIETISSWNYTISMENSRYYHSSEVFDNKIFIIGGFSEVRSIFTPIVYELEILWQNIDGTLLKHGISYNAQWARAAHSTIITTHNLLPRIYLTGGLIELEVSNYCVNSMISGDIFENDYFLPTSDYITFPISRFLHRSHQVGNHFYFIGGYSDYNNWVPLDSIQTVSVNSDGTFLDWDMIKFPYAVGAHSSVVYNNFLYILGGLNLNGQVLNNVLLGTISDNEMIIDWSETTPLPVRLYHLSAVISDSIIIVTGGLNTSNISNEVYFSKINEDGSLNEWISAPSLNSARYGHSSNIINNYIYVIGGYGPDFTIIDSIEYSELYH